MKDLKTEYKLIILLGTIFSIVLIISLIKVNYFGKKIDEFTLKQKKYIKCEEKHLFKGANYTNHICYIKDDGLNEFVISYASVDIDSREVKNLNKKFSQEFDKINNKLNFIKNGDKFLVEEVNSLDYEVYFYNDIMTLFVKQLETVENYQVVDKYFIYNINVKTGEILNESEIRDHVNLNLDLTSNIRMKVIEYYSFNFHYDYIGRLSFLRNEKIDNTVENVKYNYFSKIYEDDLGRLNLFIDLYNPDLNVNEPFLITVTDKKNIDMKKLEKW